MIFFVFPFFQGDQNAINDLMQMRLSAGGGGGMMAEKLEVRRLSLFLFSPIVLGHFLKLAMSQIACEIVTSRDSALKLTSIQTGFLFLSY